MIARGDCYTGNQSVDRRSDDRNGFTDWFKTFIDGSAYWLLAVIMDVRIRACLAWQAKGSTTTPEVHVRASKGNSLRFRGAMRRNAVRLEQAETVCRPIQ